MSSADLPHAGREGTVPLRPRRRAVDWPAWLQLARVSNVPTVVSDAVAGAALAAVAAVPALDVAVVAVAAVLFYTAGMVLNDVLDLAVDRRERPERPLPAGRVTPRAALAVVVALLVVGEALLLAVDGRAALAGLVLVGAIVVYDAWHKGNALSPLLMGACRGLVYLVAALAVAGAVSGRVALAAALLALYIVGLTQVAKAEGGGLVARWPVVAVLAPAAYWATDLPGVAAALLAAAFAAWTVRALWLVLVRRAVGRGVAALIAGVALYDALVVAASGASGAAVAACVAAFALTVALQTKIAGT